MTTTAAPAGYKRAAARTVGTHFVAVTEDHECHAACYRISKHGGRTYISTFCDAGHSVSMRDGGRDFGGSAFAASLNDLPAGAPFVAA